MPETVLTWASWSNRLTPDAEDALWLSRGCSRSPARVRRWQAEHLLLMSLLDPASSACTLLRKCGVEPMDVQREIRRRMELPDATGHTDSAAVLEIASAEALALGDKMIGTEHVLLAIIRSGGVASEVLGSFGVEADSLRSRLSVG